MTHPQSIPSGNQIELVCSHCGDTFTAHPWDRRFSAAYCSKTCHGQARTAEAVGPARFCAHCGERLTLKPKESPFFFRQRETCGRRCAGLLRRERLVANAPERTCEACGKALVRRPDENASNYRKRRACSRSCGYTLNGRARSEPRVEQVVFTCATCGKQWLEPASAQQGVHTFCSKRCVGLYSIRHTTSPTRIETETYAALMELGIVFEPQHRIGQFVVDAFLPTKNIVVECQGNFYHCNPAVYPDGPRWNNQRLTVERDARKRAYLEKQGYRLVELWERDIVRIGAKALLEQAGLIE